MKIIAWNLGGFRVIEKFIDNGANCFLVWEGDAPLFLLERYWFLRGLGYFCGQLRKTAESKLEKSPSHASNRATGSVFRGYQVENAI